MTISTETIYLMIAVGSVGVSFFMYFNKPKEKSAIVDAVFSEKLNTLEKTMTNIRDNHLHTLDEKMNKHIEAQNQVNITLIRGVERLSTILEERLPSK